MLIISPKSTCDVCMDSYVDEACVPHAIACGHIFCRACLDQIQPQHCPICRSEFFPWDIHQLRVEWDAPSSTTAEPQVDTQLQCLLSAIAKISSGDGTVEETQRIIDQCDAYHNSQPDSILHTPLGVSYLLLSSLLETRKRYSDLVTAKDDTRDCLVMNFEDLRVQYENLMRIQLSDREAVERNEEAFRLHYDEMNAQWKSKVEAMKHECQTLSEELEELRQTNRENASTLMGLRNAVISRRPTSTISTRRLSGVAAMFRIPMSSSIR